MSALHLSARPRSYLVSVLGNVRIDGVPVLSEELRSALTALVLAGSGGLRGADLPCSTRGVGRTDAAHRMQMARLRRLFANGVIPRAQAGRYRLNLAPHQVDIWHLQRLVSSGKYDELSRTALEWFLQAPAEPIPAEASAALEAAAAEVDIAQVQLVTSLAQQRSSLFDGGLVSAVERVRSLDPYNEWLVVAVALAHASGGNLTVALREIQTWRKTMTDVGLAPSSALGAVEQQLLEEVALEDTKSAALGVPPALDSLRRGRFIEAPVCERALELVAAPPQDLRLVVTGDSGVGKSRLLAEIAASAVEDGAIVLYVAAVSQGDTKPFAALLGAIPGFDEDLAAMTTVGADRSSELSPMIAKALGRILACRSSAKRVVCIFDDCQWLDSQTLDLVGRLVNIRQSGVAVLVAGRSAPGFADSWAAAVAATGISAESLHIEPFDEKALAEMVAETVPELSTHLISNVTAQLIVLSGGRPGIARLLLSTLDVENGQFPEARELASVAPTIRPVTGQLSQLARRLAAAGAVQGLVFDLGTAASLSGASREEALDGLEELRAKGLIDDLWRTNPRFTHVLYQSAMLEQVSNSRRAQWHLELAASAPDLHARAEHLAAAGPWGNRDAAAYALCRSADLLLANAMYLEAARNYRRATVISRGPLPPAEAGRFARCLDLTGAAAAARRVRQRAFDELLRGGDHGSALVVATSGLPEAEPIEGDAVIVANLLQISQDKLEERSRLNHGMLLARQLGLTGDLAEGIRWLHAVEDLPKTADERLAFGVLQRALLSCLEPPSARLEVLEQFSDALRLATPEAAAEFRIVAALDSYQAGDVVAAAAYCAPLEGSGAVPALRRWHAALFSAVRCADEGEFSKLERLREDALKCGLRWGITEAHSAYFGNLMIERWLMGRCKPFELALERGPLVSDTGGLRLAGRALLLYELGRRPEAIDAAEAVVRQVLSSPLAHAASMVALVAAPLALTADSSLRSDAAALLEGQGESTLVVGAFAASLGPVRRYLASLIPTERLDILREAVAFADAVGSPLWQLVTRRDLLREEPKCELASEMDDLATTPYLKLLAMAEQKGVDE